MYEADYRSAVSGSDDWLESRFDQEVRMSDDLILPFFSRHHQGEIRSILDIGCAQGGFLSVFGREFPDADLYGIEPGIRVAEFARYHTGADIRVGNLDPGIFTEHFDLIIITRSLNHLRDPMGSLQLARSMLNPGGSLLLNVLDAVSALIHMPFDRMAEILHPYAFTRETILALVQRAGFDITGCEDTAFDTTKLTKKEMMSPSFRRAQEIQILARAGVSAEGLPDAEQILNQISTNIRFYQKHQDVMFARTNIGIMRKKLGRWKRAFVKG